MGRPKKATAFDLTAPAPVNPLTGTTSDALPASFSAEAIAERQEIHESEASVYVIKDSWNGSLDAGVNQFEEIARPFQQANPDKHFRWLSRNNRRGKRGHELVEHPLTRQTVSVAQYDLGWIPNELYNNRQAEVEKRAVAALGGTADTKQEGKDAFKAAEGVAMPMEHGEAIDF